MVKVWLEKSVANTKGGEHSERTKQVLIDINRIE